MEWKWPWAWGKMGCFLWGTQSTFPAWCGKKGSVFLFPPGVSYCLCFLLNISSLPCFPPVFFWHALLPILHLTLFLPVFNSTNVCLVPTLLPVSAVVFFLCFSGGPRRKVEVHSFCWHHTSVPWFFCLFSHLRWKMELRQVGHGLHLPGQPACALLWLIILGTQGAWFYCFGLECVEFEGEGDSMQEVHTDEGNRNQKATMHKMGAHCPEGCQFAGRQPWQIGEGGLGVSRIWWGMACLWCWCVYHWWEPHVWTPPCFWRTWTC